MNDEEFLNSITEDDIDLSDDGENVAEASESTPAEDELATPEQEASKENQPENSTAQTDPVDEDKKMLEYINSKGLIKFNGEKVDIKDLNDLATNYQKGLNYDKHEADEKVALDYLKENASKLGVSLKEYINRVKNYEAQKQKETQEQDVQNLVNNGVPESIAREVIETKLAREKFEKKEAEYQKQIEEITNKQKEDEEYLKFIDSHPDVKADEIPQEVFELSKDIGINAAYNQYLVKKLTEENEKLKQAQQNASSSRVVLTSDGSSVQTNAKDPFLEGFDSV